MLKLQSVTGLNDDSPIHRHLGVVDELLKNDFRWSIFHQKLPIDYIYKVLTGYLSHPRYDREPTDVGVIGFANWLRGWKEDNFANLVDGLAEKGLTPKSIRSTMIFILANLEYLKEKEGGYRSIDDGWMIEE